MKKELLFGILVLLLLVTAFMVFRKPTPTTPPTDTKGITITNNLIKETSSSANYQVNVTYPEVEGLSSKVAEKAINTSVEDTMKKNIEEFKKSVSDIQKNTKLPPQLKKGTNQFMVTFNTVQATDNIVSYHFTLFQSIVGMAHPINSNLTFTYDIPQSKVITIRDLFKPNSNYLARLSDLSQKALTSQIKSSPVSKMMIQEGTKPVYANYSLFTLSSNSLIIYFNPAQVAPDVSGTQTVTIPLKDLSDILNIAQ